MTYWGMRGRWWKGEKKAIHWAETPHVGLPKSHESYRIHYFSAGIRKHLGYKKMQSREIAT
jgi:hypothetical protein